MKKLVLIIVVVSVFSFFAFPIFWGAKRESVTPQFVYDRYVEMSEMDPFDFLATKVATPVISYVGDIGDRAMYYINRGVGTLLFGQEYVDKMLDYEHYKDLNDSLDSVLDDLDIGLFQGSLFDKIGDLFGFLFGGNE